jgi:hypothetical protein
LIRSKLRLLTTVARIKARSAADNFRRRVLADIALRKWSPAVEKKVVELVRAAIS